MKTAGLSPCFWAEREEKKKKTMMTPWEQHSGREKSATKQAMCLLEKYFGTSAARESNNLELADAKLTAEKRKVCPKELDLDGADGAECGHSANEYWNENGKLSEDVSSQTMEDMHADQSPALSLVELTGSGVLLFTFPHEDSADTIQIVSHIFYSWRSGNSSCPHLHDRISYLSYMKVEQARPKGCCSKSWFLSLQSITQADLHNR